MKIFKAFFFVSAVATCQLLTAQEVKQPFVFNNGWWKMVDAKGNIIIDSIYNVAEDAYYKGEPCVAEERIAFIRNSKFGFKNPDGKVVVPAIYDQVCCFKNGMARVAVYDRSKRNDRYATEKLWGLIDRKGRLIADTVHQYVSDFDEMGISVLVKDNKLGLMTRKGKIISPFIYVTDHLLFPNPMFNNGLLPVILFSDYVRRPVAAYPGDREFKSYFGHAKVGFINRSGKLIIDTVWKLRGALGNKEADQRVAVQRMCGTGQNYYYEHAGERKEPEHPYYIKQGYFKFHDGRCVVMQKNTSIVIDTNGNKLFTIPKYNYTPIWKIKDRNGFLLVEHYDPDDDESTFSDDRKEYYKEILDSKGIPVPVPDGYDAIASWKGNIIIQPRYSQMKYRIISTKGDFIADWEYPHMPKEMYSEICSYSESDN